MNLLGTKQGDPHILGIASGSYINTIARSGATPHHDRIEPLVRLFDSPQAYFVRRDSPFRTARDVLERLRSDPASLTFAFSVGLGSPLHVSIVNFGKLAGVAPRNIKTVVFNSGTEVAAQLAGGHVDVTISSTGSGLGLVQAGNIRFLGIAYHERLPGVLADVPTMREQGVDLITTTSYQVMIPRGLAPPQVEFWKAAMARVLGNAEFKADLERNFWPARPVFHPDAQAAFQAEYDETRAILLELGFAR
jgi:putative tricarboxylic transport membrane protein